MIDGVLTPCGHRYHSQCFFRWIRNKTTCPLCRSQLINSPSEEEDNNLDEIRRQIDWESIIYRTLRNNTRTLEQNIKIQQDKLKQLDDEVKMRHLQLSIIIRKYREFVRNNNNNNRHRRRGLLF